VRQYGNKDAVLGAVLGELVGAVVGAVVGQVVPRLVLTKPSVYDVPMEPTLTRGPHRPGLLCTQLEVATAPTVSDSWTPTAQEEGARVNRCRALTSGTPPSAVQAL
jgi:hypothetical protein